MMMIFTGAIFLLIPLDTALCVSYEYKSITMSLSKEKVIKSPGYPITNYAKYTNYTWYVMASDDTEEIYIEITIDIHKTPKFPCEDYLQIQEVNPWGKKFQLFKRCGKKKTNRKARGNRLLITLISNYDDLTSKGFQLTLKVSKVGTTLTTRTTTTQSTTTKTRTTASTLKTTVFKARSTKSTLTKRTTSTLLPSTTKPLKASTVEVLVSNTTTTTNTTTQSTTSTTPLTTRKMITTIPNVTLTTNATTLLTKSRTLLTSTQIASTLRTTAENNPTIHLSQSPRNSYSSPITTESNKESTTIWLSSSQSVEMKSTLYQKSTTKTQPKQSSTSGTRNITTPTDQDTLGLLGRETVVLLIGLGVLEVTLIVVGVLAAQRYRRKRNSNNSRHASKRIDDDANTLKRQNSFGETNVYDEINIDDVKEEKEEENPYKELPEGVYDTTLKRRSYLKVVGERKSNYSRGSIINMFRTSSFFRRKVNETSVMTFSSFKGPIQSQIGEKNNQ